MNNRVKAGNVMLTVAMLAGLPTACKPTQGNPIPQITKAKARPKYRSAQREE